MFKNILLIEDNAQLIESLVFAIESSGKYKVINTFISAEEALANFDKNIPDMIIMDIKLNGEMDGILCTKTIKHQYPKVDILMLTVFDNSELVFEALKAGACGYMTKNTSLVEIIEAIDQAFDGGAPMSNKIARMVLNSFSQKNGSPLTNKEDQILKILAQGGSYKTVALELQNSVETVKHHIKNIYIKLQVNSKEKAIQLARKNKWL